MGLGKLNKGMTAGQSRSLFHSIFLQLFSLFAIQPYVLAIVVPAITMKLWTDEYKNNSAEFLLTLPVELNKIILAKFCFAIIFGMVMSLGLLPFVVYSSHWLELYFTNIISSYIGVELLIIIFCAFGIFISSLSNNSILTYILSISAFLMMIIIPQTRLIITYNDF